MPDDRWNDDIAYVFSAQRTLMRILGLWPQQKETVFTGMQWCLTTVLQLTSFIFLRMEMIREHHDAGASIETVLYVSCITTSVLKNVCVAVNRKKLVKNVNSAIDDWLSARRDEDSYRIMKRYAFKAKVFSVAILNSAYICIALYLIVIIVVSVKKVLLRNADASNGAVNITFTLFVMPSGELGEKITGQMYALIIVIQTVQLMALGTVQVVTDSFYMIIIVHLTGQLEVLKKKFETFANEPDVNHRKRLVNLINRHCDLMELNQNLEDTFHLIILLQLVIVTLLLALIGLRVILSLDDDDYILMAKSILVLNFVFTESLVYTYGGDFVQRSSEDIFYAMFATPWYKLPVASMKDLRFAMMRSSYPLRLTAGKFFYANRETTLNVVKTAASYISVLRVALKE